jgi:hypothetical protein
MSKLKGIKGLERTINNFLFPFGLKGSLNNDFSYEYLNDKVNFSIVVPKKLDNWFKEYIYSQWGYIGEVDIFLLSLLHEIGHSETWDEFEDNFEEYSLKRKQISFDLHLLYYTNREQNIEEKIKELHFKYFDLPEERAATEWAVEYIKSNSISLSKDWNKISKAIIKFVKLNNIEF